MKTVPSLVASSTVGIAAAGLALGRPERSTPVRPSSRKRKVGDLADVDSKFHDLSSPISRPGTSSTVITPDNRQFHPALSSPPASLPPVIHQRPHQPRVDTHNDAGGNRLSMVRNTEFSSPREHNGDDARRDSISSRGSWIKRLSTIPISQNNSPRSSIGPDSPSLTFSHGSAAPIMSNLGNSPAPLPPNKLVKRATSGRAVSGSISRSGSKSQVPTLRRPATSHQRTVNLQQKSREHSVESADFNTPSKQAIKPAPTKTFTPPSARETWRPFFESRPTKLTKERTSTRSSDGGMQNFPSTSRRVMPDDTVKPTLLQPGKITMSKTSYTAYYDEDSLPFEEELDEEGDVLNDATLASTESPAVEPHKRARRSLSMHFSSPGSWISRSGSLRGSKRNPDGRSLGKRYSSAPGSTMPGRRIATAHGSSNGHRAITDPTVFQSQLPPASNTTSNDPFAVMSFQQRVRNSSSPLPPLSRLSSFNVDLARLGLSSSSSSAPQRSPSSPALHIYTQSTSVSTTGQNSPGSPLFFGSHNSKPAGPFAVPDRDSTLIGSDSDAKGFASGDEDDMDFQSETVFDSLRSGATGSMRSHNTQLDAMFDESPPSINTSKTKRLSIHELLANGVFREGNDRIVEEDEGMSTPVKGARSQSSQEAGLRTPVRSRTLDDEDFIKSSPPSFSLATNDFGRLSLDDAEEDEDWTRDDENPENTQLSPPSSAFNSRRVSPSFRAALADVTHSSTTNEHPVSSLERPKSNLFDWSEPSSVEKMDYLGNSPRPKTAHVKHIADGRGGRALGRRGPSALHIRSQSVPVVPDVSGQREHSKLTPKFGTWGLGAKGVSEEWDGDFEFESPGADDEDDGDSKMESSGMLVPPAIQASQESVVGHVGQIREVCLLVEDLKRLRLLAREKDLLGGASASLWKEAEGIIALAVPDEEDPTLLPPHSPASVIFGSEVVEEMYVDEGPDAADIERPEAPFEVLNRHGRPTGFVYNGDTVRRRSVFSPDDDIFGAGAIVNHRAPKEHLRLPSTSPRPTNVKVSSEYARSVMETMHQHRSTSDPIITEMAIQTPNKMPFDTTSLRDLVNRASVLARTLAELIRKADSSQSPDVSPHRESSPAFTRVFTDPMASPPKRLGRSQSNNSILSGSIDSSPTRTLGQRMHMMTVV